MRGLRNLSLLDVCRDLAAPGTNRVDPRKDRVTKFDLVELLFSAVIAVLCGAQSYVQMEIMAESKLDWMRRYLPFDNGIPSAATFRNVLSRMNPDHLHKAFAQWTSDVIESLRSAGVLAIDGKTAKGTRGKDKKPLHVVSAFSSAASLVIGQMACEQKSNEITAIPKLLDMLDITGCLVTIDAMGTQRNIADKIVSGGGDYLLQVKGNQKTLYHALIDAFAKHVSDSSPVPGLNYAVTDEMNRGRHEIRECFMMPGTDWMGGTHEHWPTAQFGALIRSKTRRREDEEYTVTLHYFIGSRAGMTAEECLRARRAHWSIESQLHWVLDVQFGEDRSKSNTDHSAENFNLLRHMAYNALRETPELKGSFSNKQLQCLTNNDLLDKAASHLIAS